MDKQENIDIEINAKLEMCRLNYGQFLLMGGFIKSPREIAEVRVMYERSDEGWQVSIRHSDIFFNENIANEGRNFGKDEKHFLIAFLKEIYG